jgi:hypothetical protein
MVLGKVSGEGSCAGTTLGVETGKKESQLMLVGGNDLWSSKMDGQLRDSDRCRDGDGW